MTGIKQSRLIKAGGVKDQSVNMSIKSHTAARSLESQAVFKQYASCWWAAHSANENYFFGFQETLALKKFACIGMLLITFILQKHNRPSGHCFFTWNEKVVVCRNTFLKGIVMLRPALMLNGPWALGGRQTPCKGKMYSPPLPEDKLSCPFTSPSWWGPKQTSTQPSDPAWEPGEALTLLSTVKSGQSVCRREVTRWHDRGWITVITLRLAVMIIFR